MKKYTGACHCGVVTFEVTTEADIDTGMSCNCSHCEKKGLLLTFLPEENFRILSGENYLTKYQFNKKVIDHLFCNVCGVQAFGKGNDKEGKPTVAINVRCIDGINIESLVITKVDGKNW